MPTRTRKNALSYRKAIRSNSQNTDCVFCKITPKDSRYISETKSFKIVRNKYPYSAWDSQNVEDHLMIVPKKHTDSLGNLTASEAIEYMDIIGSYESRGYNIYSRAPHSPIKTVVHQHTHLIKPGSKRHKLIFYIRKPYVRIVH